MKSFGLKSFLLIVVAVALAVCPARSSHAGYQLALSEFESGNYEQAAAAFQTLVEQSPSYDFGHYMLGLCHLKQGEHGAAAASLRKAIEFNRDKFEYFHGLAQALHRGGDYSAVIETLNEAADLVGEKSRLPFHSARGLAHVAMSSWQDAAADLEIAHSLDPDQASAADGLALAYFKLGRYNDAVPLLRHSLRAGRKRASNYKLLAESLLVLKQSEREALETAGSYRDLRPDDPAASDLFGRAALAAGRFDVAISAFSSLLVRAPDDCSARINLALALLATERAEEAERTVAAADSCDALQSDAYATLGMIQRTRGKYDDALQSYERAYSILPASSSYQAIQEIRHNIEVREYNLAADRQDEDVRRREQEMTEKIERWNQFTEQD